MAAALDIKEYELLFRAHYEKLCYFAFDYVNDIDLAHDVVSDVFTQLWKDRDRLNTGSQVKNFLYVCVRNRCINELRKSNPTVNIDDIDETHDMLNMEWVEAEQQRIAEINSIIDTMSVKTQRVLQECYFNNHTYKETAEILGITPDGVKKHIVKAFALLRNHFKVVKGLKMLLQIPIWLVELLYLYINN